MADVASVALIHDASAADTATVATGLQAALTSRVRIEQTKGMLAHHGHRDTERAGDLTKRDAQAHDERLSQVATHLITRTLQPRDVLDSAACIRSRLAARPAADDVRK